MTTYPKEKIQPATYLAEKSADKCVSTIKNWQQDSEGWVGTWESNQDKWHKLRMRIKKKKTFPFVGCSNIRMPTLDTQIRKIKASIVNLIFGIRPVVQAEPDPSGNWQTAKKIEKFLDHLIMDKIKIKNKSIIGIDQSLEKGFYLIKPYWRCEITERVEELSTDDLTLQEVMWVYAEDRTIPEITQELIRRLQVDTNDLVARENLSKIDKIAEKILKGETEIRVELQDVTYNCPDIDLCSPERVYVPTTTGVSPQDSTYLIHEFFLPIQTLEQNIHHKGWSEPAVDDIKHKGSKDLNDKKSDISKDEREGIERLQSNEGLVKIWECYCWYDINDDGKLEKAVITIAPEFNKLLRKITLPTYSGKFPFVKLFYEMTDDRWFSHRGLPELIEDIVKEIDIQHMQKIDYGTLTNSPMYAYRAGMVNPRTVQFVFGQGLPVHGMQPLNDSIQQINSQNPNINFSYEREQMILETKIQELVGQLDFSLQSMINKREPRTLGEVELQSSSMQQVQSLSGNYFREQFEELFNWIWELWCQYGDDSYEFAYFGKEGWEQIKLTKEEIQGKYKITIRGNDQNTNPKIKLQKAQMILMGVQNPIALQTGVVNPVHIANAYKRFYQELDIPNWQELVASAEQIQQMIQMQQKNKPDDIKVTADDLTEKELAQVLLKRGIKPDLAARLAKQYISIKDAQAEKDKKITEAQKNSAEMIETLIGGGNGK